MQAVILGRANITTATALPLFLCRVPAGFPSPADDHLDGKLDLNDRLITHPTATFFAQAEGHSMVDAGIYDGDLLIVNRALRPRHGCVVVACVDGELTVKRYCVRDGRAHLDAENPEYPNLTLTEDQDVTIWGVVTHNVHPHGPPPTRANSGSAPPRDPRGGVTRRADPQRGGAR